ncbi:hypothetical protein [Asaia prunellae]|uniref:hypothetical protein n=1 Tax=Asaia prunellae TaxID=610245 RepID=UPI0004715814|nr:hypothetical protein [Asaia prunellae]
MMSLAMNKNNAPAKTLASMSDMQRSPVGSDENDALSRPEMPEAELRRAAWTCSIGSAMEYYDFALYSLASALVFGPLFSPAISPVWDSSQVSPLISSVLRYGL